VLANRANTPIVVGVAERNRPPWADRLKQRGLPMSHELKGAARASPASVRSAFQERKHAGINACAASGLLRLDAFPVAPAFAADSVRSMISSSPPDA